jgi:hypothetical protein
VGGSHGHGAPRILSFDISDAVRSKYRTYSTVEIARIPGNAGAIV